MKLFLLALAVFPFFSIAQFPEGNWQGLLLRNGQKNEQANIIYLNLKTGACYTREELPGKDAFAFKKCTLVQSGKEWILKQQFTEKKVDASGNRWCMLDLKLNYNDSTGYLEGTFTSSDCRGVAGKIICYPSEIKATGEKTAKELQSWRPIFLDDLKHHRKSLQKRAEERANFHFEPIYFDYDKSEIRMEYTEFLVSIIKVVQSHSDLRVRVTGYTDADGSDAYNIDLSKRRAQAIVDFFVSHGIPADRLKIDFKGEAEPIGNNQTPEGKQLNRRVDFSFI